MRLWPALVAATVVLAPVAQAAADTTASAHRRSPCLAYLSIDAQTGRVLAAEGIRREAYPASCTKLMTMRLAFRAMKLGRFSLDDVLVQSERSAMEEPSKIGLEVGETITVDNAFKALMVKSANDVAVMVAEKVGGTVENFVDLMNIEARNLGMKNTHYASPNGLPPPKGSNRGFDISTAEDLAKLAMALLRDNPEIIQWTSIKSTTIPGPGGKPMWLQNHNNVLWKKGYKVKEADGLKTGFIKAGGCSLVLTGERGGKRAIVVVLGSNTAAERDALAGRLLKVALDKIAR